MSKQKIIIKWYYCKSKPKEIKNNGRCINTLTAVMFQDIFKNTETKWTLILKYRD